MTEINRILFAIKIVIFANLSILKILKIVPNIQFVKIVHKLANLLSNFKPLRYLFIKIQEFMIVAIILTHNKMRLHYAIIIINSA